MLDSANIPGWPSGVPKEVDGRKVRLVTTKEGQTLPVLEGLRDLVAGRYTLQEQTEFLRVKYRMGQADNGDQLQAARKIHAHAGQLLRDVVKMHSAGKVSSDQANFLKTCVNGYRTAESDSERRKYLRDYGESMGYFTQKVAVEQVVPPEGFSQKLALALQEAGLMAKGTKPQTS